jgi:hypothetical protein
MHAGTYRRVGVTAARAESPFGVMTMSVHKLTAGSGYDYLTRQVAALDATNGVSPLGCGSGRGWTGSTDLPLATR